MPKSEVMNPFEAVDPEIIDSMKSCTTPYLRSVIIQIITQYPEMADPVKELLVNAKGNCGNDRVNKLLVEANFPCYPEHSRLSDFDSACLSETEQIKYKDISELSFLHDPKKPNVFLHGLAGQGREKIAIGLGDAFCRAKLRAYFISYDNFIKIIRTHGVISGSNNAYNELMKKNCLIIDNFAEKTVYDEELLDEMAHFIQSRADAHRESYIQHKHNPKTPFVPFCTIVTSSFEPADWTNYMKQDDKKTYNIARFFCDNYAVSLHVDENKTPANAE